MATRFKSSGRYLRYQELLQACILCSMRDERPGLAQISDPRNLSEVLRAEFIADQDIDLALDHLIQTGLIVEADTPIDMGAEFRKLRLRPGMYGMYILEEPVLSQRGIDHILWASDDPRNAIAQYQKNGDEWLAQQLEEIAGSFDLEPLRVAEDRTIPLNSHDPNLISLNTKLEHLIAALKSNNSFVSQNLEENRRAIENLERAQRLLKTEKEVEISKLEAMLYGTLSYIALTFVDQPLGDLANGVWEATKNFVAHLL